MTTVLILALGVLVTAPQVHAQETNSNHMNFFQGLIQSIAQKFGLDQTKVQSAVDDYNSQQKLKVQQRMQDKEKNRLDQLVKDGKITSAQEQAIITEFAALKTKYNPANLKNLTPEQRKAQFDAEQNEIKSWAQSQGIDPTLLLPGFGLGRHMRGGMHWGGDWDPSPTP